MRQAAVTIAAVILAAGMTWQVAEGKTIYADADAAGANNGTTWADAYMFLQDALTDANSSEKPVEIRVAQGVYQPDRSAAEPNGTGDREATFRLISGVALKGGYAGFGEPDPNARDIELYETILSGDLDGNDGDVDSALDLWHDPGRAENSYHVVAGSGTDEAAVLDGFTITGGNADGSRLEEKDRGGGMYTSYGDPIITNCTFIKNSASYAGGGAMYNYRSSPTLRGCVFKTNVASRAGGGMFNTSGRPKLAECTFVDNVAYPASTSGGVFAHYGGGLYNVASNLTLTDCTLHTNYALYSGGGIYSIASDLSLTNCLLIGNSAFYGGGAASLSDEGSVKCINCTLAGNRAHLGSALNVLYTASEYTIEAINCILWDGGKEIGTQDSNNVLVSYSVIQGGWPGEGNVDADPCFAEPGYWTDPCNTPDNLWDDGWTDGDWHVKSQGGRWESNERRWVIDEVTSPCIDAGDPMSPIGFEPFPNGGIINIGAYGGTAAASKSYFGKSPCQTIAAGDVNGDCKVNFLDFGIMAMHWLEDTRAVNSDSVIKDGIEYYLQTDKCCYSLAEDVEILYRVTNLSANPVDIGEVINCDPGWCHVIIIDRTDTDIWEFVRVIPPCGWKMFHLESGQSEEARITWHMLNDNGTLWPDDDFPVAPGTYRITSQLRLSGIYDDKKVPVALVVEIINE